MISKIVVVALFASSLALAAISANSADASLELLSMPLSNQKRLLKSDKKTLDKLIVVAEDMNMSFDLRWKSIMALGFLENQNVNPAYLKLAKSKEWFVKNGLLIAMDENNHPQKFATAKSLVKDPSLIVRSTAFDILMQHPTHRDLLWEELFSAQNVKKKRSLWVRPKIINYMSKSPKAYERSLFEKLTKETEPEIVNLANKGLQKIKSMSATETAAPATKTF